MLEGAFTNLSGLPDVRLGTEDDLVPGTRLATAPGPMELTYIPDINGCLPEKLHAGGLTAG